MTIYKIVAVLWLTNGDRIKFAWYDDYFAAKAYHQKNKTYKWGIHSVW